MPPEALALVAHYLRSQNEFIICKAADGWGAYAMNEGLYYQVGVVELLPSTWRWSRDRLPGRVTPARRQP